MPTLVPKNENRSSKRRQKNQPGGPKGPKFWLLILSILLIAMLYGMTTGDHYYFDKMVEVLGKFAPSNILP